MLRLNVDMKSNQHNGTGTLSIGALAARFGLATHVLRHWEAMGLLHPGRDAGGRRRYGPDDLTRVATILVLKEAGLGLTTIRSLSTTVDRAGRQEVLRPAAEVVRTLSDFLVLAVQAAGDRGRHQDRRTPGLRVGDGPFGWVGSGRSLSHARTCRQEALRRRECPHSRAVHTLWFWP
ncbi:MerR family transcriptional regulator [Streptomyces chartreusis]|uniref:MerR family transcriptional regulator n=1 Tax=Streptomyces chartreusis TaxID=1969 RepID=UPI0033EC6EBD